MIILQKGKERESERERERERQADRDTDKHQRSGLSVLFKLPPLVPSAASDTSPLACIKIFQVCIIFCFCILHYTRE